LSAGEIREYLASLLLPKRGLWMQKTRREVDAKIAAVGISQMGSRSAAACPQAFVRGRS